jgi:hypothetical protein
MSMRCDFCGQDWAVCDCATCEACHNPENDCECDWCNSCDHFLDDCTCGDSAENQDRCPDCNGSQEMTLPDSAEAIACHCMPRVSCRHCQADVVVSDHTLDCPACGAVLYLRGKKIKQEQA